MTRPHVKQYGTSSPAVRYSGGGTAACFDGRDQESIQLIVENVDGTLAKVKRCDLNRCRDEIL